MSTFWDACVLLKNTRENGPIILKQIPEKTDAIKQKNSFIYCSFPETQETDSIFAFSINKHLCFSWSLLYEDELYAIVIVSHHCFPYLFLEFLKNCKKAFTQDPPEEILDAITVFLSQWKYHPESAQLSVVYPTINFTTTIDATHTFFMQFDPSVLIGNTIEILDEVWQSMITGKGVLFIGENAEQVSKAIFSALSLVAPLRYADHFLVYTKLGDQRFADIIGGSKKWKIVGTTNQLASERCKQFHTVIKLTNKNVAPQPELRQEIQKRMHKLKKRVEIQFNKNVEEDPYSDLLEIPLTYPQILEIVSKTKLAASDFQLFQKSQTFSEWRKSITIRAQFRDSLLSISPESVIENRPDDELVKIQKILQNLPNKMPGDDHIKAVINQHLRLIRKRLEKANLPNKPFKH